MAVLEPEMVSRIDEILEAAHAEGRHVLYEHEVYRILGTIGVEVPRFLFVRDPSSLTEPALRGLGTPIVAKIVSPGVTHKQRVGGVKGISTAEPLYVAVRAVPHARGGARTFRPRRAARGRRASCWSSTSPTPRRSATRCWSGFARTPRSARC